MSYIYWQRPEVPHATFQGTVTVPLLYFEMYSRWLYEPQTCYNAALNAQKNASLSQSKTHASFPHPHLHVSHGFVFILCSVGHYCASYTFYLHMLFQSPPIRPVLLNHVIIHGVPNFDGKGGCRVFLKVYVNMKLEHTTGL
jgi:hypothetical protein